MVAQSSGDDQGVRCGVVHRSKEHVEGTKTDRPLEKVSNGPQSFGSSVVEENSLEASRMLRKEYNPKTTFEEPRAAVEELNIGIRCSRSAAGKLW